MENNEQELINQTIRGNTDAYTELVNRYKNAVYRHCFAMVRDEDVAEDVAQDTFIAAYYHLKSYNPKYSLATWLFKIGTNKCLDHLRKQAKFIADSDDVIANFASTHDGPVQNAISAELHDAVKRLKPNYQAVISLHYWQGLDYSDTALAMNAPVNSVRVWLKRAKEDLRKELS